MRNLLLSCVFILSLAFTANATAKNNDTSFNIVENSISTSIEETKPIEGCLITITTRHPDGSTTIENILVIGAGCDKIIIKP